MDQISVSEREELIKKFKKNPLSFSNSPENVKNDREIVLELLKLSCRKRGRIVREISY